MSHIFISYAHTDGEYARKLADYLLTNGFDVWIDDRIDFGSRWIRSIFKAIDDCGAFIVIMTPRAFEREMVENERLYAKKQNKPVFPLLLEEDAFPDLGSTQYYDVRGGKLPAQVFLDRLATFATRSGVHGQDVASVPQQQAKRERETAELERAAAKAQAQHRQPSFLLVAVTGIAVVALVIFVVMKPRDPGTPSDTTATLVPTATAFVPTEGSAVETTHLPVTTGGEGQGQFAFVSNRNGNNEIYSMNLDGTGIRNLTNNPAGDEHPSWSPDGSQIAFMSYRDDASSAVIYIMDADGGNVHRLIDPLTYGFYPAWSPDGKQIAMTFYKDGNAEVYVVDSDGNNLRRVTNHPGGNGRPTWSPDSKRLAFESVANGNSEIYVVDADGSNMQNLTKNPAQDTFPAWSPDGTQIMFQSNRDSGNSEIYVMDSNGDHLHPLTTNPLDGYSAAWSPDGTQVLFSTYRAGTSEEIYLMDADGSHPRRISVSPGNDDSAVWRP